VADTVIVGGGIIGLATAWELAKRGASVTVLEYGKAAMQATNAAAGMLAPISDATAPDAMMRIGMQALRAFPALVAELRDACGFDLEFVDRGILRVAFNDQHIDALRRRYAWQRELGISLDWLDAGLCRELEPRLSRRVIAGVLSPSEAWISNQLLALALMRAAEARGARVIERAPLTRATQRRGRIVAVEAAGETHPAKTVVVAAGARSGQIARRLGVELPVEPVRGQMIALGGMQPPIRHVVWGPDGYLVPRANGLVFAGATVERVGFRRRTTRAGIRAMRRMARDLVPQLAAAALKFEWAGLRPMTPDALPVIGPVPGTNIVAATGHYRSGILLGPITGAFIAAGIAGDGWTAVPEEFAYRW
jgi:glycine oxidase